MKIESYRDYSEDQLLDVLNNEDGSIAKCKAICEFVRRKDKSQSAVDGIMAQLSNSVPFWNRFLIGDFAAAALDLLGVRKYRGNKYETMRLIESGLRFT